ncbi:glycosyltransferase [Laspinema olomoucense]|uniref:Glycosyltransferase n=1 Tax=Laspinema olomoucense D3b TaxID=2953688 RepID=A0ABT2N5C9_9CYAN|nr:glycosyltransferase [Laspinema sp. D3b]MCT7976491.1 glycosyltransferase [Laspinema sp. D3b]
MRILIVSAYFPPFNTIGSVRVGKMAKYLSQFGNDVRVLTIKDHPVEQSLPLEISSANVIQTNYINYIDWIRPRKLVHLFFVIKSKFSKRNVDLNTENTLESTKAFGLNKIIEKIRLIYGNILYFPDSMLGWIFPGMAAASHLLEEWKPDLIYASSPPPTSLILAHLISRKYGIPWVAELRDLWVENPAYDLLFSQWRKKLEAPLERLIFSSAQGFVTVSEPLAEILKEKYQKSVGVILNGFDFPNDFVFKNTSKNTCLRIVYTGKLFPLSETESIRKPDPLFKALKLLGEVAQNNVEVIFYGADSEFVEKIAIQYKVEHIVKSYPPIPYQMSLEVQLEADILLLILWNDPREKGVFTGKLFEYIGAHRPILAIGSSESAAEKLIQDRKAGVTLNDPEEIAEQLLKWIHQKETIGQIPGLTPDVLVGLSREEQAKNLETFLKTQILQ